MSKKKHRLPEVDLKAIAKSKFQILLERIKSAENDVAYYQKWSKIALPVGIGSVIVYVVLPFLEFPITINYNVLFIGAGVNGLYWWYKSVSAKKALPECLLSEQSIWRRKAWKISGKYSNKINP